MSSKVQQQSYTSIKINEQVTRLNTTDACPDQGTVWLSTSWEAENVLKLVLVGRCSVPGAGSTVTEAM